MGCQGPLEPVTEAQGLPGEAESRCRGPERASLLRKGGRDEVGPEALTGLHWSVPAPC